MPNHPNRPRRIWTFQNRQTLAQQLVKRFGPYSDWEGATVPGRGMNEKFDAFCADFARAIGAKGADAVRHQIQYMLPIREGRMHFHHPAQTMTRMLCMAAAYTVGFITHEHFPKLVMEREARQAATIIEQPELSDSDETN